MKVVTKQHRVRTVSGDYVIISERADKNVELQLEGCFPIAILDYEGWRDLMSLNYDVDCPDPLKRRCESCYHTWREGEESRHFDSCKNNSVVVGQGQIETKTDEQAISKAYWYGKGEV